MEVLNAVSNVFNLSGERGNLFDDFKALSPEDRRKFLYMTSTLLKLHKVGNQQVRYKGETVNVDAAARLGDERLRHAKDYHGPRPNDYNGPSPKVDFKV